MLISLGERNILPLSQLPPNESSSIQLNFTKKIVSESYLTPFLSSLERITSFDCKSKILLREDCTLLGNPTFHTTLFMLDSTKVPTFLEKIAPLYQQLRNR